MKTYEFDAPLREIPEKGGAYIVFPYDVRAEFGTGRRRVHASFDGIPYDGSLVNMGLKNPDGSVCWIIGVRRPDRNAWIPARSFYPFRFPSRYSEGEMPSALRKSLLK